MPVIESSLNRIHYEWEGSDGGNYKLWHQGDHPPMLFLKQRDPFGTSYWQPVQPGECAALLLHELGRLAARNGERQ